MKISSDVSIEAPTTRTRKILLQTGFGLIAKFGAFVATLLAMPLMLNLLGAKELGTWLVLLSVFQWITMFDLGLSAGARNEIARAVAVHDELRVRQAITTGWLYVFIVSITLFLIGATILYLTQLPEWLAQQVFGGIEIESTLWIILAGACAAFALNFIQSTFAALEKASAFSMYALLTNVMVVLFLVLAIALSVNGMEYIAIINIISMFFANTWLILQFKSGFPQYFPSVKAVNHKLSGAIIKFGLRIFVLQITTLIIFASSRMMASAWLGPESVVVLDAAFRVFSIVIISHTLLMTTIWSSFTQAFERKEFLWIRKTLRRLIQLMFPLSAACILLAVSSPFIVRYWLGDAQVGLTSFYILLALTTFLTCWSNIFAFFLNSIGDTRIQIISAIFSAAIFIPVSYLFTQILNMGLSGVVLGTLVSLVPFSILGPYVVSKLLNIHEI